ncbi:MAG: flavodoxin [Candidatus Galacturonibacter soehngenii]|nr:flavodoxin [Candidatus Galacturonibacter soehngenii]
MSKIQVIYWTQTGNTEAMAQAIAKGITASGKEAEVLEVSQASLDVLKEASVFALGCPAMGAEVLEENEMEPFVEEVAKFVSGKNIALFGSYGWGDGEWMRDWEARMKEAGANLIGGAGLICNEAPDDALLAQCVELGKQIAAK